MLAQHLVSQLEDLALLNNISWVCNMSKTKEEVMESLWNSCRAGRKDWVEKTLGEDRDRVDLADPDHRVFNIVVKKGYDDILQILLDFYTTTKLQHPEDSMQYRAAFVDLQSLLYNARESCATSDQIEEILKPYLSKVIDTISERDELTEDDILWKMDEDTSDATATKERRSNSSGEKSDDHTIVLPFTADNLDVLKYPYWQLNIAAEASEQRGDHLSCINKITGPLSW